MTERYYTVASNYQMEAENPGSIKHNGKPVASVNVWYHPLLSTDDNSVVVFHQLGDEPDTSKDEIGLLNQRKHFLRFYQSDDEQRTEFVNEIGQIYDIYSEYFSMKKGFAIGCDDNELKQHMANMSNQFGRPLDLHFIPITADIDIVKETNDSNEMLLEPEQVEIKEAIKFLLDNASEFNTDRNLPVQVYGTNAIPVEW